MKNRNQHEKGALAIEAVLGLTIFMLAILALMFMTLIIRVQASVQYALGQTAKEISGYYYLLDKVGLTSILSGDSSSNDAQLKDLNNTIGYVIEFSGDAADTVNNIDLSADITDLEQLKEMTNFEQLRAEAQQIGTSLEALSSHNPMEQFRAVLSVFGRSLINRSFSCLIGGMVCKSLVPKYLTSGDINDYYEKMGIENMDFSKSQLLADGRSIKLVATYTISTKALTLGMIDSKLTFKQVVTTAAWVKPNGKTVKSLAEIKPKLVENDAESGKQSTTEDSGENTTEGSGDGR